MQLCEITKTTIRTAVVGNLLGKLLVIQLLPLLHLLAKVLADLLRRVCILQVVGRATLHII